MSISAQTPAAGNKPHLYKTLFATCIGNALEWFDIAVYGFFASYIAHAFFPTEDPAVSLLLTFGSFGVSFLIRPLGAVVLGAYADRVGRKKALLASISLMMLGGVIITFMPSYATIGLTAPLMILLARLIQGFSAGGEFGSSTAFLVEHFPERKAFIASWQFATQGASTLLASAFGLGMSYWLSEAQIQEWGWRIPFAFGLLIGPVGLWAEKVGRLPLMWGSLLLLVVSIYPAFRLVVNHTTPLTLMLLVGWMALLKSVYFSTVPSLMADLFPMETRASGMAIGYNVAVTVFGGFAPLICTLLISLTGTSLAPSYYLMMVALLSGWALLNSQQQLRGVARA